MAESTSFENPAFDNDDDEGNETAPFVATSSSTPGPSGEEIPMQKKWQAT